MNDSQDILVLVFMMAPIFLSLGSFLSKKWVCRVRGSDLDVSCVSYFLWLGETLYPMSVLVYLWYHFIAISSCHLVIFIIIIKVVVAIRILTWTSITFLLLDPFIKFIQLIKYPVYIELDNVLVPMDVLVHNRDLVWIRVHFHCLLLRVSGWGCCRAKFWLLKWAIIFIHINILYFLLRLVLFLAKSPEKVFDLLISWKFSSWHFQLLITAFLPTVLRSILLLSLDLIQTLLIPLQRIVNYNLLIILTLANSQHWVLRWCLHLRCYILGS